MAHHDTGEKISERRRAGVMSAGFVALVGNKTVPFHRGTELPSVQCFAVNRRYRPSRFALFTRAALCQLSRGDFFEVGFHLEHRCLQIS